MTKREIISKAKNAKNGVIEFVAETTPALNKYARGKRTKDGKRVACPFTGVTKRTKFRLDISATYERKEPVEGKTPVVRAAWTKPTEFKFAFILVSTKDNNTSTPRYVMVDGIPDFTKTGWNLINPTSYLLQDLVGMRKVVKEVFEQILASHMVDEHGTMGVQDIKRNLLRKDYANLSTGWLLGNKSVDILDDSGISLKSNGTMEVTISYSFDVEANPEHFKIKDKRYYYQKSPIWDESDHTIFSSKYMEDDLFSVVLK